MKVKTSELLAFHFSPEKFFQNLKMVGKHRNSSMKRMNKEVETLQDELKDIYNLIHRVVEEIAKEPEVHEVGQILFDLWDIFKKNKEHKMLDSLTSVKKGHKVLKCNLCEMTFDRFSDLETHLITSHEAPRAFHCNQCEKTFVTKWRLRKHMRIHSEKFTRICHYFKDGKLCPFEELGCKFLHDVSENDIYDQSGDKKHDKQQFTSYKTSDTDDNKNVENQQYLDEIEGTTEIKSFYTSTPKKSTYQCENCQEKIQCDGCYVDEYIQNNMKMTENWVDSD